MNRHRLKPGLEPPAIAELAEALADGTWLDMRVVDAGDFERVKVTTLHIYRDRDVVTVVQNFKETPESTITQFNVDVDCEDIMYMTPTECESVMDVNRIELPEAEAPSNTRMKDAAITAVAELTGGSVLDLVRAMSSGHGRHDHEVINRRHLVLWAMFEMTDLKPPELCWELGWRSPMPFQTARYKFNGPHTDERWPVLLQKIVDRARELGGPEAVNWSRTKDNGWLSLRVTT